MWIITLAFLYIIARTLIDIRKLLEKDRSKEKIGAGLMAGAKILDFVTTMLKKPITIRKKKPAKVKRAAKRKKK